MSDIFSNNEEESGLDSESSAFESLVGDSKKFKTTEDLARGKMEADRHIQNLEKELAGLREDLNARLNMESFLDRLEKSGVTPETSTQAPLESDYEDRVKPAGLSMEDVDKLVSQKLEEKTTQSQRQQNTQYAIQKLQEAFGPRFGDHVQKVTDEMGLGRQFLEDLAATNPNAFLKFVGADKPQVRPNPDPVTAPRSSFNTASVSQGSGERTQSYYDKLRKEDPGRYWDKRTQAEMHRMALKLGEKFFE